MSVGASERSFVEIVGRTKVGKPSRTTHRLFWAICDQCSEGTWVNGDRLTVTWACPRCRKRSQRKGVTGEVPICEGRTNKGEQIAHEPIEMIALDGAPGVACRMTPRCKGKHRKEDDDTCNEGRPAQHH